MITELSISGYRCFPASDPVRLALPFAISSFLGINNTGKSSLLRMFFELRNLFQHLGDIGNTVNMLRGANSAYSPAGLSDPREIFCNFSDDPITLIFSSDTDFQISVTIPRWTNNLSGTITYRGQLVEQGAISGPVTLNVVDLAGGRHVDLTTFLECCRTLGRTLYIGPFRNAINLGSREDYYDISCGVAFIEKWRQLKTGDNRQDNEAIISITNSIKNIFQLRSLEIDASNDSRSLHITVNDRPFKQQELGSGLLQFIIVLANAVVKRPSLILIDEPELNLHPSLQLDFLTTMASHATDGLLFSTHSYGLARSASENIYSVKALPSEGSFVTHIEEMPDLAEFLGELSFSGYRELGYDKVLLVEGRTEVKTVQQFLRLYGKDHKIVLLPMGGGELINSKSAYELEELKRLTDHLYALIDSEKMHHSAPLAKPRRDFVDVCSKSGITCHVLERRALEHYLTDSAVKQEKGTAYRSLSPFEDRSSVSPVWGKNENWRIARRMTKSDIEQTDLGEFFESL